MNGRVIFNMLGRVCVVAGALLLLPFALSVALGEACWWTYAATLAVTLAIGLPLMLLCKPKSQAIYSREGLIIVSLAWVVVSVIGALPFIFSGTIPSFVDALFEMVSGFTTTGASILTGTQIEALPKSLQLWRCFTHWIGGMGIIVFVMAVVAGSSDRSMHVLRAEMPGPVVDKIVPRARNTAKILYLIYIVMTVAQILMLWLGGMPLFDSVVNSFSTAGTGGFGIKADSIASYSAYSQWVIAVFMILFGVNFNVYFLILVRRFKTALTSTELLVYVGIIIFSAGTIAVNLLGTFDYTTSTGDAVRHAVFQVASFMTTTGNSSIPATSSINVWPTYSKLILFLLMFVGGCAGSTAGGLKVSRVVLLWCAVKKELKKVLHPRNASSMRFEGKPVSDETMRGVTSYFGLYMLIYAAILIVLCADANPQLTLECNLTAAASCLNNVGPAYGVAASGYYMYSDLSKIVLTLAMLMGRLEIYPILLTLSPATWVRKA